MLIGLGDEATAVNTGLVVRNHLTLRGSLIYDHPGDFSGTIGSPVHAPGRVLRASYPLERASEAFRAAREVPGKTWIRLT